MDVRIQPKWINSTTELRNVIDPKLDSCTKCRGHSKSKATCRNPINQDSRSQITPVLLDIIESGSISRAATHFERLASLVLCKRWHQTQASEKAAEWGDRLGSFLGVDKTWVDEQKQSDHASTATPSSDFRGWVRRMGLVSTCSRERNVSETKIKADPATSVFQAKNQSDEKKIVVGVEPTPKQLTREAVPVLLKDQVPVIHHFTPYCRAKQVGTINKNIIDKLCSSFTTNELDGHHRGEGYIYGYKLPDNHKITSGETCRIIKIGFTNDPQRRMGEWQKKCHYAPLVVFMYKVAHHVKMEKIVHIHLSNERRKEYCPEPECKTTHKEFFEVDALRAEAVVRMWAAWARLGPFDQEGNLSPYWLHKLDELDAEDPGCWESFIFDKVK